MNARTSQIPLMTLGGAQRARRSGAGFSGWFTRSATRLIDTLLTWQERARQRYRMQALSDHMLSDMGLSRADIDGEIRKPFWR